MYFLWEFYLKKKKKIIAAHWAEDGGQSLSPACWLTSSHWQLREAANVKSAPLW